MKKALKTLIIGTLIICLSGCGGFKVTPLGDERTETREAARAENGDSVDSEIEQEASKDTITISQVINSTERTFWFTGGAEEGVAKDGAPHFIIVFENGNGIVYTNFGSITWGDLTKLSEDEIMEKLTEGAVFKSQHDVESLKNGKMYRLEEEIKERESVLQFLRDFEEGAMDGGTAYRDEDIKYQEEEISRARKELQETKEQIEKIENATVDISIQPPEKVNFEIETDNSGNNLVFERLTIREYSYGEEENVKYKTREIGPIQVDFPIYDTTFKGFYSEEGKNVFLTKHDEKSPTIVLDEVGTEGIAVK